MDHTNDSRSTSASVTGDLTDAAFERPGPRVIFTRAVCRRVDFSDLKLDRLASVDSIFDSCTFDRFSADSISLGDRSVYRDCAFGSINWKDVAGGSARFERCNFTNVSLIGWRCYYTEFVDCVFTGLLKDVEFHGRFRPVRGPTGGHPIPAQHLGRAANEFRGNDFSGATLENVELIGGIDPDAQRWPDPHLYRRVVVTARALAAARSVIEGLPDVESRRQGLWFVDWLPGRLNGQSITIHRFSRTEPFAQYWAILEDVGRQQADVGLPN